jgi:outer membrane protein assembly factor BamB
VVVGWLFVHCCRPTLAGEGDWPRWRGETLDGRSSETGLLSDWPSEGPPLAWRSAGLGRGYSSLAVSGPHIFTLGEHEDTCQLLCLDRSDGRIVWQVEIGRGEPNSTPTVAGDTVYALSRDGMLAAVAVSDGRVIWRRSFKSDFGGSEPGWGYSESPLVDGDTLIATPGAQEAYMVALDRNSGRTIWQTTWDQSRPAQGHGGAGYASPVISHAAQVKQYVTRTGNGLIGVDSASGRILWVYDRIANGTANIPTPIVQGDLVLGSSGYDDGGTALVRLVREGAELRPQEVYYFQAREKQNHHGGMILHDGYVYMGHGHNNGFPLCFELLSGRDAWRPGRGPGQSSAAVAYADGHLYFRYQDATMALVEATPDEYRLKGSFKLPVHNGESWSHPVIAGGHLYLRDQDELVVYDLRRERATRP